MKVCDKTCIFRFFPIINKYLRMAKRSLLSERLSYNIGRPSFRFLRVLAYYTIHNHHHIRFYDVFSFLLHSCIGFSLVCMDVDVRSFVAQVFFFFFPANPSRAVGM